MATSAHPAPAPAPSPGILREFVRELAPNTIVSTLWRYLRDHRRFFDEVFREDWTGKTHPVPFFLAIAAALIFAGKFSSVAVDELGWQAPTYALKPERQAEFLEAVGVDPSQLAAGAAADSAAVEAAVNERLRAALGLGPLAEPSADQVAAHLRAGGHEDLADKLALAAAQHREAGDTPLMDFAPELVLLLYLIPFWKLSHRFLKAPHRTSKQTVYVQMYNTSGLALLVYLPMMFVDRYPALLAVLVAGSAYSMVKMTRVLRYTHGVGFWAFMWASVKTSFAASGLVLAVVGVGAVLVALAG